MRTTVLVLVMVMTIAAASGARAASSWLQISAALDYTPHGTQPGLSHELLGSDNCANCHTTQIGGGEALFFPYDTWAGSMMANATRDPVFWAALDVANHDQPGVGDYCLRCHTPSGWYGGRVVKNGSGGAIDGSNGCLLRGNYTSSESDDYSGESCHYCHRLMNQGPQGQPAYTQNGNAWLDDTDCNGSSGPCRRGPYNYVAGDAVGAPPHPWAQSAYHQQSAICGLCHNVSTPDTATGPLKTLINASGTDTGIAFPVERTFSEWQRSDFADVIFRDAFGDAPAHPPALAHSRQCQDCHMPNSSDPNAYACNVESQGSRSGNLATHTLVGGNTWVPGILSGEYGAALSVGAAIDRQQAFAQTMNAAQLMLQGAAQVGITPGAYTAPTVGSAGSLALNVRITNLSGHKLPTGYAEGRRMWLNVQVRDAGDALVAESGAYDVASGVLTTDAQVRIYEVLQGIWNNTSHTCVVADSGGKAQFHFVLNNCIAKDNRIPPLGFTGVSDPETMPVAHVYASAGAGRIANYDDAAYAFNLPAATQLPLHVTATLYYQTASKDYIEFLRNEAVANTTAAENALCTGATGRPFNVGPQSRARGEYLFELWNNAANDASQPGYGKSPPQAAGNVAAVTVGN
jgi:hypothetical protein